MVEFRILYTSSLYDFSHCTDKKETIPNEKRLETKENLLSQQMRIYRNWSILHFNVMVPGRFSQGINIQCVEEGQNLSPYEITLKWRMTETSPLWNISLLEDDKNLIPYEIPTNWAKIPPLQAKTLIPYEIWPWYCAYLQKREGTNFLVTYICPHSPITMIYAASYSNGLGQRIYKGGGTEKILKWIDFF